MEEENYYHLELPIEQSVLYIQDYLRRSKNGLEEILWNKRIYYAMRDHFYRIVLEQI